MQTIIAQVVVTFTSAGRWSLAPGVANPMSVCLNVGSQKARNGKISTSFRKYSTSRDREGVTIQNISHVNWLSNTDRLTTVS